jgi:hypothetical protein
VIEEPLFSCQANEFCRTEVSYPAGLLRVWSDQPICEGCYDMEVPRDEDDEPWEYLPPFVPAYRKAAAKLVEENKAMAHDLTRSMDTANDYLNECERLAAALKRIAAEAYVSADSLIPPFKPNGWRDVAVERIDIARQALAAYEGGRHGSE